MTEISASAVASLRSRTGVSILLCKKALEEAGGDEEKAIEALRKSGEAQAVKKAGRDQAEGSVFAAENDGKAALVFLMCETDFVARNEDFQAIGASFAEELLSNGEDALKSKAEAELPEVVQKLGENISLGEHHVVEATSVGAYVHSNGKIGVVVGLDGASSELAKDAAMHAAAMNPQVVSPDEVSDDLLESEKNLWKEQLESEGKPAEIMDKIMEGKEKKFREENALISQEFVKEPGKTVGEHLDGANVTEYIRIAVG